MVAYLKAETQVRMYSDYLRATREAKKEDSIKLPWSPRPPATDGLTKPRATNFFPLRKLKGSQPFTKKPTVRLAQLEEEGIDKDEDQESDDPNGIEGITEEFMVQLARVVKGCSDGWKALLPLQQPRAFYLQLSVNEDCQRQETVKWKGGDSNDEGSLDPSKSDECWEESPKGGSGGITPSSQTPFLNPDPFQQWYGMENIAKVKINGKSCMALLDNGAQVNTITLRYVQEHSMPVGLITDLMASKVTCMGLGNAYTRPLGYVVIWVQVDGVWGYDEDQIALIIQTFPILWIEYPSSWEPLQLGELWTWWRRWRWIP